MHKNDAAGELLEFTHMVHSIWNVAQHHGGANISAALHGLQGHLIAVAWWSHAVIHEVAGITWWWLRWNAIPEQLHVSTCFPMWSVPTTLESQEVAVVALIIVDVSDMSRWNEHVASVMDCPGTEL